MDDRELLELLRTGEEQGLDELLRQYGPLLRYVVSPILDDPREREECLSDISLLIWDRVGQYSPARGTLRAWLTALARNAALNRLRSLRRRGTSDELPPDLTDPAPGPEETVLRQEEGARIQAAVDRLSPMDRTIFYRKYYYLQSSEQMAAELGLSRRALEGRIYRLRQRLRRELGGEDHD